MVGPENAVEKPVEQLKETSQIGTPPTESESNTATAGQASTLKTPQVAEQEQSEATSDLGKSERMPEPKQSHEQNANEKVEPAKSKKAAGEVFSELKNVVVGMDIKMDEISRFVHLAKDKLVRQEGECIRKGKLKVLESFFQLHDMLFSQVMAMEAGSEEPNSICIELMKFAQDIFRKHGIEVIVPQPGDSVDNNYMESLRSEPAKFWRKPGTVAKVDKCGYAERISETEVEVLRPARVIVYRKLSK